LTLGDRPRLDVEVPGDGQVLERLATHEVESGDVRLVLLFAVTGAGGGEVGDGPVAVGPTRRPRVTPAG
jgi:hypothetical protein